MANKGKPDHDATMMLTPSMILPLPPPPPPRPPDATQPVTPDMVLQAEAIANDATSMLTPDMIVNDESAVMGRDQIERALAVVGLWHVALQSDDRATLLGWLGDPEIRYSAIQKAVRDDTGRDIATHTWATHTRGGCAAREKLR